MNKPPHKALTEQIREQMAEHAVSYYRLARIIGYQNSRYLKKSITDDTPTLWERIADALNCQVILVPKGEKEE